MTASRKGWLLQAFGQTATCRAAMRHRLSGLRSAERPSAAGAAAFRGLRESVERAPMPEPIPPGRHFAFLLIEKFSMFSLAAAIDTVRSANRALGRDFYSWTTVSPDGEAAMASNGLPIKTDYSVADLPPADILFVCVGLTTEFPGKSKVLAEI